MCHYIHMVNVCALQLTCTVIPVAHSFLQVINSASALPTLITHLVGKPWLEFNKSRSGKLLRHQFVTRVSQNYNRNICFIISCCSCFLLGFVCRKIIHGTFLIFIIHEIKKVDFYIILVVFCDKLFCCAYVGIYLSAVAGSSRLVSCGDCGQHRRVCVKKHEKKFRRKFFFYRFFFPVTAWQEVYFSRHFHGSYHF